MTLNQKQRNKTLGCLKLNNEYYNELEVTREGSGFSRVSCEAGTSSCSKTINIELFAAQYFFGDSSY